MRVRSVSAREPLSEPESAGATASTSTVDLVLDLEKALERFKQMAIDSERPVEGKSSADDASTSSTYSNQMTNGARSENKEAIVKTPSGESSKPAVIDTNRRRASFCARSGRFSPYAYRNNAHRSGTSDASSLQPLRKIKLDGDVDALRMCLLDERKEAGAAVSCGVQAKRPATPPCDGEVDELADYFAYFVRVDLKMSSLAESMYV